MKKWINFIVEWFLRLWRLVLYISGVMALILEVTGALHGGIGLLLFLNCMVIILLPRINDEVVKALFEEDDKEN